ncbi:S1 family peptidase [Corynebacterium antarcticum]|uniref:S1 family peptidase n=1 Tax=Corynebacterium antarcticum TaxID=2800405 RepID=UPI002260DB5A|nr:serine protease [Corynebacterium antarcticum]MCX7539829.1 serine protease [Corynebacterium antarcticum]
MEYSLSRPESGPDASTAASGVVRLHRGGRYCSGFLTTPEILTGAINDEGVTPAQITSPVRFALTAAHFLTPGEAPSRIRVSGPGFRGTVSDARVVVGTDIAVVKLDRPAPVPSLLPVASAVPPVFSSTITYGYGGRMLTAPPRRGLLLARVPFALSLNLRTRVRHAAICVPTGRDQVVYGDSGGPVLVDGEVAGLQSLLFGYRHRELFNVATVALLAPHLAAVRRAVEMMSAR